MDLLKKVELLLNAKTRSALPRRERGGPIVEEERKLLTQIREALGEVQRKEQELAGRIKTERHEAETAHQQGDIDAHLTHTRRAAELEHHLTQESTLAINLEDKLAALEEKLAQAQAAVEREAQKVADRDTAAEQILNRAEELPPATPPPSQVRDDVSLNERKSRLSG